MISFLCDSFAAAQYRGQPILINAVFRSGPIFRWVDALAAATFHNKSLFLLAFEPPRGSRQLDLGNLDSHSVLAGMKAIISLRPGALAAKRAINRRLDPQIGYPGSAGER